MDHFLSWKSVVMAPVVLAELLSDPLLAPEAEDMLLQIGLLDVLPGYWRRAGRLRAELLRRSFRPKLADTLIAQSCIDYNVPLLTRDRDFGSFVRWGALELA
jgi:predicted nucleic acid-binding protein